ncbi:proliferation marker protein Ki-67 isoform X1 [Takifugu flavidus]|uniref:proliferation marker protein Ki-67 isoform X1 n=1 Tax=Takifugu flavidus TaxID=433684 RepID=UPI0025445CD9|nr:proliferation marker protein Ki-67 isoform X1 [Takifugu flavidus]
MPLHGKIVVIKRSGGDGTEFPLTATCLFGRKPDCDIRIQLPQVSKEHCRIDLNENKEVILTNLSSVNPTLVNGEVLQQSERLKHGDVITVIDRSFRFEYPPAPTPKKRSSIGGKAESVKVLRHQQVKERSAGEKEIATVSTGLQLKDGTNHDNIQRSLEKTMEMEEEKTTSPFNDLYQMIKKSLDVKTPRKSSISLLQTPSSRVCSPKPVSVKKNSGNLLTLTKDSATPKQDNIKAFPEAVEINTINNETPKSVKKQRRSSQVPSNDTSKPEAQSGMSDAPSAQNGIRVTPQRVTSLDVTEQVASQTSKSTTRRSKEATPAKQGVTGGPTRASPRNSENLETVASKKRKSGELPAGLPTPQMKKKRVSFGSNLSPELFDKRMPPNSPLRKGATPRRSFCLSKPKDSLLRRVSVIGMIQEHPNNQSPAKMKTTSDKKSTSKKSLMAPISGSPSPKAETPGKKTPKSRSPSPKAETPGKKTPKSRSPSPKAETPGKKTPKSRSPSPKAETPGKKTPKSRSPSPKAETSRGGSSKSKSPSPVKRSTPSKTKAESPGLQTPTIKGRFSVSRISTPSPASESGAANEVCLDTITPKLRLKRKSMKSTSRKSVVRSSVKVMCRKSGISRGSMKAMNSWAEIVKFGQKRAPVGGPVKAKLRKTTVKKALSKPQTPASKLQDQVSTGHADSPVTIVVGRAHRQKVPCPTGAAPRWISNVGVLKKDMKMDEDLTGISEMFKTPATGRKPRPIAIETRATKTTVADLSKSVIEPSVLNTPEEPGEMMVSPLSVSTTVMDRSYNCEAVQRLFIGEHQSSFVSEIPAMEVAGGSEQSTDAKTPMQKPILPNCQTGVNRVKTPRQKAEPTEDLRGKILKTPKQKIEQKECLTGIKRIMKTPRQKNEPLEDLRGKILKTPMQKMEPQECLSGVKRIFSTPQQQAEDPRHEHLQSHEAASSDCIDQPGMLLTKTPPSFNLSLGGLSGVKRLLKTPRVKASPVEDMVGVKRLLKTPREKGEPVADNFGIKRLMKSPKLKANAPVEDFEGLKELMEPLPDPTEQEKNEAKDETDCAKGQSEHEVAVNGHAEQVPHRNELSDDRQITQAAEVIKTNDSSKEKLKLVTAVKGRGARMAKAILVEEKRKATVNSEESSVISAPARGRRGKKPEATAPPIAQRSTRSRKAKSSESSTVEGSVEQSSTLSSKVASKLKGGQNAKKASDHPGEMISKVVAEAEIVPEPESKQTTSVNFREQANENLAAVKKPRGRRPKPGQVMPAKEENDSVSHAGKDHKSNEDFTPQSEVLPIQSNENKSSDNMETALQDLTAQGLSEMKPATQKITEIETVATLKKCGRVGRAKVELTRVDHSESPTVASGISKRGKNAKITQGPSVRATRRNAKLQECKSVQEESVQLSEVNMEVVRGENFTVDPHHREAATKSTRGRKPSQALTKPLQAEEDVSKEQPTDDNKPDKPSPTCGRNTRGKRTKPDNVQSAPVEEMEQKSAPPARTKRGQITKEDEGKVTTQSREPVKNQRRTRNVEQDPVKPSTVLNDEQATRRAKKAAQEKPPAESDDVQKSVAISVTDKPKQSRRTKQVGKETSAVVPEEKPELKADEFKEEAEAAVGKRRRVKNDVPEPIQAKRARRGATPAPAETNTESPDLGSKSEPSSKELPKRGRRAAKPSADVALLSGEELKTAVVEDANIPTRSVRWKSEIEIFGIQKVKPVQGRKSKVGDRASAESQKEPRKTEEKDLSDEAEVHATKRARRGVRIAESIKGKHVEPETQPKTRSGRLAKK